jgi:hypothetical protein
LADSTASVFYQVLIVGKWRPVAEGSASKDDSDGHDEEGGKDK